MANHLGTRTNLDFMSMISGVTKNGLFFENDEVLIYSPTIQGDPSKTTSGFDIQPKNLETLFASTKRALIIVRYYQDFIILEVDRLKSFIDLERDTRVKYSFKVKKEETSVEVYISKNDFRANYEVYSKKLFVEKMRELYQVEFEEVVIEELTGSSLVNFIYDYIQSKGFNYSLQNIKNLYLSLRSKPFVIISGISGTGKTKIVQLFAESVGATEDNGQFTLIPVRPDWSDGSELLGYKNIQDEFKEGLLTKVVREASEHRDRPYFVLLDEMNLARVEYYFSDFLSIMESRKKVGDEYSSSLLLPEVDDELTLPENLYIIGTVNMDETTHPFSKKVLDRANTLEFNEIYLDDFAFLMEQKDIAPKHVANASLEASYVQLKDCFYKHQALIQRISAQIMDINNIIEPVHAQVGYRVRDEICFYLIHNEENGLLTENEALDNCFMQKILPRLAGSGQTMETVLENLYEYLTGQAYGSGETGATRYPRSAAKTKAMRGRLTDGFTSFWDA